MSLEDSGPTEVETLPLSRRQRRDLVELVAAGVMSAVFFALPVVMVRDTFASKSAPPPAPEARQAAPAPRVADPKSVQVVTTDVAVPMSSPELQAAAPAVVHAVRWNGPPRSRQAAPAVSRRPSLGRRHRAALRRRRHAHRPAVSVGTGNRALTRRFSASSGHQRRDPRGSAIPGLPAQHLCS